MKALYFPSQRYMCMLGWGGGWGRSGVFFSTGCYVRAFQTLETWYWPLFPEGVSKETLRLVSLLNTSLYCVRNKSSLLVWSQAFNQTACALSWAPGNLLNQLLSQCLLHLPARTFCSCLLQLLDIASLLPYTPQACLL